MEIGAALFTTEIVVKSVAPVNSQQSYNRQVNADSHPYGTFNGERVEIAYIAPAISAFQKYKRKNSGLRL